MQLKCAIADVTPALKCAISAVTPALKCVIAAVTPAAEPEVRMSISIVNCKLFNIPPLDTQHTCGIRIVMTDKIRYDYHLLTVMI